MKQSRHPFRPQGGKFRTTGWLLREFSRRGGAWLWGMALVLLLGACKNRPAEGIPSEKEMADLLYDYHLAQSLAQVSDDSVDYKIRLYTASVFRKHGLSEQEFNRAMEYYSRHADELYKIYERVNTRFGNAPTPAGLAGVRGEMGDSASIWNGRMCYLLNAKGQNYLEHAVPADTAFRPGDRIIWSFDTQWIYREGAKNGVALITITYQNDSVFTVQRPLFGTGHQELTAYLGQEPVKRIECMIYQQSDWSDYPRMLAISNVALVRVRAPRQAEQSDTAAPADTLKRIENNRAGAEQRIRDSLLRADTARRPHFREEDSPRPRELAPVRPARQLVPAR